MKPQCLSRTRAKLGENPLWVPEERRLYWLDLFGPTVHAFDSVTQEDRTLPLPLSDQLGCMVRRTAGGLLLATGDAIYAMEPATSDLKKYADLFGERSTTCFNDGKVDRQGRFWIGTSHSEETDPLGALYRIDANGEHYCIDQGFAVSNGPAFSPDGRTLYFVDSAARTIYAYELNPDTGAAGNRRVFARVPEEHGYPDGLTVDENGFVWSAHWDGWRITRYTPKGDIDCIVSLPVPKVTSCCFGGAAMSTLFVTTASVELSEAELAEAPLSGGLFAIETPFRGIVEPAFLG